MEITEDIRSEIHHHIISANPEFRDFQVGTFSQIIGGADTTIFKFDLVSDSVTVPLILRMHRPGCLGSAHREYQIMKDLYAAGLDIPRPYILLEKFSTLDRACIVMERIQGQLLSEQILSSYPGTRFDSLIRMYMKTMAKLHSFNWSRHLSFLDSDGVSANPQLSIDYDLLMPRKRAKDYDIKELTQVISWLDDNRIEKTEACLVHGDFHPLNIIVTDDSRLITLDWTNAKLADFRMDLGFAVVAGESSGLDIREQMIAEYEAVTKKRVEQLEFFMVLSCLHNVFRVYSAIFDHKITGESEETEGLFRGQYSDYARYIVTMTQETTGVSLARILDKIQ